ncbi:MAG: hypothetical protein KJ615_05290, partial [Bacteroidetes bacterium]|nr:hypothetical protein [Bacteroidota bacterium]
MIRINYLYFLLLLIVSVLNNKDLLAQETINGLIINSQLQENTGTLKNSTSEERVIHLPFFDDFSASNIRPDQQRWINNQVFINKDFPVRPPNTGAATFDVLNEFGQVYENASTLPFKADELQSVLIRLDSVFDPS